jgi:hypothetical protein
MLKEGLKMKKKISVLVGLSVLFLIPSLALADCCDLGGFTSYAVDANNTVILYAGNVPVAKFSVQCSIQSDSKVQLLKTYMCDGDELLVDGSRCMVNNVTSTN